MKSAPKCQIWREKGAKVARALEHDAREGGPVGEGVPIVSARLDGARKAKRRRHALLNQRCNATKSNARNPCKRRVRDHVVRSAAVLVLMNQLYEHSY
eukprot:4024611-Pleurochrysis_carterae.AAC.2